MQGSRAGLNMASRFKRSQELCWGTSPGLQLSNQPSAFSSVASLLPHTKPPFFHTTPLLPKPAQALLE